MCPKTRPALQTPNGTKDVESVVRIVALRDNVSRMSVLRDILLGWTLNYPL